MCEQFSSHSTAEIMELVSRNLGQKNHALAVRRVGRGDETRRGEEAAMAISITRVSENNGQIMTVKVVNVNLLSSI